MVAIKLISVVYVCYYISYVKVIKKGLHFGENRMTSYRVVWYLLTIVGLTIKVCHVRYSLLAIFLKFGVIGRVTTKMDRCFLVCVHYYQHFF